MMYFQDDRWRPQKYIHLCRSLYSEGCLTAVMYFEGMAWETQKIHHSCQED